MNERKVRNTKESSDIRVEGQLHPDPTLQKRKKTDTDLDPDPTFKKNLIRIRTSKKTIRIRNPEGYIFGMKR